MVFRIAYNGNATAASNHYVTLRHAFRGIVCSFGVNVRTQQAYKFGYIGRVKDGHCINITECCQNFRTFLARNAWPAFAFECTCAGV